MSKLATTLLGALLLTCLTAASALALVYPPGTAGGWPGGSCPDSVNLPQIQNIAASCHPASNDTVMGVGGIITGMDTRSSNYGFYIQCSNGGTPVPFTGIQIYTGTENWNASRGYARGDSVIVSWGQYTEYSNAGEIQPSGGRLTVRKVNTPPTTYPLPAFKSGSTNYFSRVATNPNGEAWEGCLVRVPGPLRVARLIPGTLHQFLVVDNVLCPPGTSGICDSVYVEPSTLCNPILGLQTLDAIIQSVQGVWEQYNNDFEIKIRDASDLEQAVPPALADGYAVADDTIRVVFDRPVTQASAEDFDNNYSLLSGDVLSATLEAGGMAVDLGISTSLIHGQTQTVNVTGVVSVASGLAMGPASRSFYHGVTPISMLQAPDPAFLSGSCEDRSKFAGAGNMVSGGKLTYRGVCTAAYPIVNNFNLQDASSSTRNGVLTYGPIAPIVQGHQYLFVGQVQEYFGELEALSNVYLRDEGVATTPAAVLQTVAVLKDSTCDSGQSLTTGRDFDAMLVKLSHVKIVSRNGLSGDGFDVAGPYPTYADTMHVTDRGSAMYTFTPDSMDVVDVTGALNWNFGEFVILPRSNADIVSYGLNAGVPGTTPSKVSFAAYPNPARITNVSFTLPKQADVDLSVYDLSGRKIATLVSGSLPAATYSRKWDGAGAGAGVYFIRLRAGTETYNLRTVSLK
jgi:hypothetical protein